MEWFRPRKSRPWGVLLGQNACQEVAMSEMWFYVRDKKKVGPIAWEQLQQLARSGHLGPDDMVLKDGLGRWQAVATLSGLLPRGPSKPAPPPAPAATRTT